MRYGIIAGTGFEQLEQFEKLEELNAEMNTSV